MRLFASSKKIGRGSGGLPGRSGFILLALLCLGTSARATDVYGTFVAHAVEIVGSRTSGTCNETFVVTSNTARVTYPCGYQLATGTKIDQLEIEISTPYFTPRGTLIGNQTIEQGAQIDFDGSVPVTVRASVKVTNQGAIDRVARVTGFLGAEKLTGANQTQPNQVPVPEKIVAIPTPGTATALSEASANIEIANGGSGTAYSFPATTRGVVFTQLELGSSRANGEGYAYALVQINSYYDFTTEPRFPKLVTTGLTPGECTPGPAAPRAPLAPAACTPDTVSFGTVPLNSVRKRYLYVRNSGSGPLTIFSTELLNAPPGLTLTTRWGEGAVVIPPNGNDSYYLKWIPNSVINLKDLNAKVRITTNDPDQPVVDFPVRGQSVDRGGFESSPRVGTGISFGYVEIGETKSASLLLYNDGSTDLQLKSVKFIAGNNVPGLTSNLESLSFPQTLTRSSTNNINVEFSWTPQAPLDLRKEVGSLVVETDDPDHLAVLYPIYGTSLNDPVRALEEIFLGWLFDTPAVAPTRMAETGSAAAVSETATLTLDPAVSQGLTAQVPAFLGGGSVQLTGFSGEIDVSLDPIPGDSAHKRITIEGGLLTAPSAQLPGGPSTGVNTLTFGLPEESGGTLDVATGNYTAYAGATIYNQLVPSGLSVRGNYHGVYNAQSKKISVQSKSEDLFVPKDQPLNISTRMRVLAGDNVLIGGFIIVGTEPKRVIIRGIGPSLTGVGTPLADPTLVLRQGATVLATNDNWKEKEAEVQATTIPPSHNNESAIVATLQPGAYTAVLAGKNNGTGVGVVEVYDLARGAASRLANISSRGFVDTGNNVMIGGLIIGSPVVVNGVSVPQGGARAMVRAIGPSLGDAGVQNSLQDPTLELRDGNGALVDANDNWRSDHEAEIIGTTIPPSRNEESAIVRTLSAGSYTAIVRGVNNTTGIAVVEVYNLQ